MRVFHSVFLEPKSNMREHNEDREDTIVAELSKDVGLVDFADLGSVTDALEPLLSGKLSELRRTPVMTA